MAMPLLSISGRAKFLMLRMGAPIRARTFGSMDRMTPPHKSGRFLAMATAPLNWFLL